MSNFSVGNTNHDRTIGMLGQSFTPNVPGPAGSGGPGSATSVCALSIVLGFATASTSGRAATCYIYSAPIESSDDIGSPTNRLAVSESYADGASLGANSHTRTFSFGLNTLSPATKYYVYFSDPQSVFADDNVPYAGGALYDEDMSETTHSAQFIVNLTS